MERTKESVVKRLADAHYAVEPGIVQIVRLLASPQQESDAKEPVKLLEVNEHTTSDGIRPVYFGPHAERGIFYPSIIVEVTPDEFAEIRKDPSRLPNDWRIGGELRRSASITVNN